MTNHRHRGVLLGIALASSLFGCAHGDLASKLEGRSFLSESVTGHELVQGTRISLTFGEGTLAAEAGCNSIDGSFTIDSGVLHLSSLRMTETYCSKLDAQDHWLAGLLKASPGITYAESRVTLSSGVVRIELVERKP